MNTHAIVLGPMALLAGIAFAACGESSEGSGGAGGEGAEPACAEGATREAACGSNDRGTLEERCVAGAWEALSCEDPDECVDGVVDRTDFCDRRCDAGAWVDVPCAPVQVSVGSERACAVLSSGRVACWGRDTDFPGMLNGPTLVQDVHDVVQVSVGYDNPCMLLADGRAHCVGQSKDASPQGVSCTELSSFGELCMLTDAGEVWCEPSNPPTGLFSPAPIARVKGLQDAVAVRAGPTSACASRAGGTVQCWSYVAVDGGGWGTSLLLEPFEVSDLTEVVDLDLDWTDHWCAVVASGEVVCSSMDREDVPTSVQLSAGNHHSCVRTLAGEVWCWGDNSVGQLGQGHTDPVSGALPVLGLDEVVDFQASRCGGCCFAGSDCRATCALRKNGEVWCWGANANGLMGHGSTTMNPLPVRVPLPGGR